MDIQFLSEYLEFIEVEKGLSSNTVDAYRNDLTSFFDFCQTRGVLSINKIDRVDLNAFILKLREDKYTPSSVMRKVASLRGFFKWFSAAIGFDTDRMYEHGNNYHQNKDGARLPVGRWNTSRHRLFGQIFTLYRNRIAI